MRYRWAANVRYPLPQPRSAIRSGSSSVGRRRWPLSIASVIEASRMRRNSSTWRYFACRLGFIRPSWSESPSATNTGSSSGSSRPLSRSWSRSASTSSALSARVQQGLALLRHPHLVRLRRGVHVPVAERLVEQRVHGGPGILTGLVVRGVRLPVVVRRHLEAAAGLQVDVPQLHPSPPRRSCRAGARTPPRARARRGRGSAGAAGSARGAAVGQASGRHFRREAITTIRRRAPRATGMTSRRWRGFTGRVYGWPGRSPSSAR